MWKAGPRERPSQVVKHGRQTLHELFVRRILSPSLRSTVIPRPTPVTSRSCGLRRPSGENSPRVGTTRPARFHLGSKSSAGGRRGQSEVSARTAMIGTESLGPSEAPPRNGSNGSRDSVPIVRSSFCLSEKLVRELAGDRTHHRPSPRLPMHEPFGQHGLCHVSNSDPGRRGATWR